jgi:YcaO-like protein with predicted kinase domain
MKFKSSPKVYRNYKSADPEHTLKELIGYMQPYYLSHMQFRVKPNEYGTAWGAQMTLFGDYAFNVRSNGKGDTPQLAILSALAEFTERVQSFLPFPIANFLPRLMLKPEIDKSHPDFQKWYTFNQTLRKNTGNKTPLFEPFDTSFYKFYDVLEQKDIYLDQSFLISPSNGRAAGNTYEEATIMAITEIFERYTTRKVLINHKALPSISLDILSDELKNYIHSIENDEIEVYIKDFSLGQGFPVVGMLFGNPKMGYVLKSSSDLSLNRAVARCLSDFFQNFESVPHRLKNASKKSSIMIEYYEQFREYLEKEVTLEELTANRFSSDSVYSPMELSFLAEESDEEFIPWDYAHDDFLDELQEMKQFFKNHNFQMWVCDLGWLGFPTVMVYSPELQQYKFSIYDRVAFFEKRIFPGEKVRRFRRAMLRDKESIFEPIHLETLKDPTFLYQFIFKRPESVGVMRGLPHVATKLAKFNAWQFLGLLAYYFKDYALAKRYFRCALIDNPQNQEIQCAVDFLNNLTEYPWENGRIKKSVLEMQQKKLSSYPKDIVYFTINTFLDIEHVKKIIEKYLVPCPYYESTCHKCLHRSYCTYGKLYPIFQKLAENYSDKLYFFMDPVGTP